MNRLSAKFSVVTPMFLAGADQRKAELKATSVKGMLRFWWRALVAESNLADLKAREKRLFGSTQGQAEVHLSLSDVQIETKTQKKWSPNNWEAYVGYGLVETTGGTSREYIVPGSEFTLNLVARNGVDDSVRKAVLALGLLGGLGGRSRKGWGAITLESLEGWSRPTTPEAFEAAVAALGLPGGTPLPKYTSFSSGTRLVTGPVQRNSTAAHRHLATAYKDTVKGVRPKRQREQFGLPRDNAGPNRKERRASPLFLHVHALPDGKAIPVALYLPAVFLENQARPTGGDTHIQAFLKQV